MHGIWTIYLDWDPRRFGGLLYNIKWPRVERDTRVYPTKWWAYLTSRLDKWNILKVSAMYHCISQKKSHSIILSIVWNLVHCTSISPIFPEFWLLWKRDIFCSVLYPLIWHVCNQIKHSHILFLFFLFFFSLKLFIHHFLNCYLLLLLYPSIHACNPFMVKSKLYSREKMANMRSKEVKTFVHGAENRGGCLVLRRLLL